MGEGPGGVTEGPGGVTEGPGGVTWGGGASKECDGTSPIASIKGDCTAFIQCTGVGKGVKTPCPAGLWFNPASSICNKQQQTTNNKQQTTTNNNKQQQTTTNNN